MSILHEIGYYDGREEGELTPSPSDEDEPDVVMDHRKRHMFQIGFGNVTVRSHQRQRNLRRRLVEKDRKATLPTSAEAELRLRILALSALKNRSSFK